MMEAVRLAAEMDYDLQKEVYEAIRVNWQLFDGLRRQCYQSAAGEACF